MGIVAVSKMGGVRLDAYQPFDVAMLTSIFLVHTLAFIEFQFQVIAIIGLGISVLMLATLRRLEQIEEAWARDLTYGELLSGDGSLGAPTRRALQRPASDPPKT